MSIFPTDVGLRICFLSRRSNSIRTYVHPSVLPLVRLHVMLSVAFLDASSHLYKRVCPSVGRGVRLLIISSYPSPFYFLLHCVILIFEGAKHSSLWFSKERNIRSPANSSSESHTRHEKCTIDWILIDAQFIVTSNDCPSSISTRLYKRNDFRSHQLLSCLFLY